MKRFLPAILLFIGTSTLLRAQQDAQYTQFFLNKLTFNSGFAGTDEKICALGVYRSQWVGFGSADAGASPTTYMVSVNAPLGDKFGVGLNIAQDQLGFQSSVNPMLSLSYRYHFRDEGVLAAGVGIGFLQAKLAGNKLTALDIGDPKIPTTGVSASTMDVNGGLYYTRPSIWRFDNFYAGVSGTHLNQGEAKYTWGTSGIVNVPLKLHYFIMTGASYRVSPALSIDPNIFVKTDGAKTSVDINAMAVYNEKFKGGLTYRSEDAIAILIGYKFTPDMQIGYSYDLTTSNILTYSTGSHELLFKYCFMPKTHPPKEKIIVPRLTPRFL